MAVCNAPSVALLYIDRCDLGSIVDRLTTDVRSDSTVVREDGNIAVDLDTWIVHLVVKDLERVEVHIQLRNEVDFWVRFKVWVARAEVRPVVGQVILPECLVFLLPCLP